MLNLYNETFWKKIKFFLLFTIVAGVVYISVTKFLLKVSVANNSELLESISEFEQALSTQRTAIKTSQDVNKKITEMEFDIHAVQLEDEIKRETLKIEYIHRDNKLSSKYGFSVQLAKILMIYFESRKEHSSLLHNKELIKTNLDECQANI